MTMAKDDFYVGYLPKAPGSLARWLRRGIITLLILFVLVAVFVAGNQYHFASTNFEYGQPTELKGVVSLTPVPMLTIETGKDLQGKAVTQSVLLVNFGKSGVEGIFKDVEKGLEKPLADFEFTLSGTLIYGEGKTVFELTDQHASIIGHTPLNKPYSKSRQKDLGEQTAYGEIIDPKCYFGVMKPGFGKVHRSCAIRCIAGGISPVIVKKNDDGTRQFILLAGNENTTESSVISKLAGRQVTITGHLTQMDDWLVLKYNDQQLSQIHTQNQKLLSSKTLLDKKIPLCN